MSARTYGGGAAATTLNGGISAGATSIVAADASTWPSSGAFSVVIDRGLAGEEKVLIASRSTNTLTAVTRGYDGTTAAAHTTGAAIECCGTAIDFQEANDHHNTTGAVHAGASVTPAILIIPTATSPAQTTEGSAVWDSDDDVLTVGDGASRKTIVGTTATQTLTNKTLTAPVIATISNTGTLTLPTGPETLVGRATTDTLTNKTISGASNTLSNIAESSVTNLVSDLALKATDSLTVHLAGTESITGAKTFSTNPTATNIPVICTAATRPGSPANGQLAYETDTGRLIVFRTNGSIGWQILSNPTVLTYDLSSVSNGPTSAATELTLRQITLTSSGPSSGTVEVAFSWYNFTQTVATDVFLLRMYDVGAGTQFGEHLLVPGLNSGGGVFRAVTAISAAGQVYQARIVRSSGTGTASLVDNGSTRVSTMTVRAVAS